MFIVHATHVLNRNDRGRFALGKDDDHGDTGNITDNESMPKGAGGSGDIAGIPL